MTRRPHLSVTPYGLAYISGDWQARAEQMLETIVRNQT